MRDVLADLDRLLEHRTRLALCVLLARGERIAFSRLKELLGETDGNLGANLTKLVDAGYVTVTRTASGSRTASWYAMTTTGHRALSKHLSAMEALTRHATD